MRIQEVDPSDPRFSGLINFFGIGIGSDTGGNRQMVMVTDGFASNPIFTVASSLDSGESWQSRFAVTQGGNVGIGTTAPAALLHIQADQDVTEYLHLSGFDDDGAGTRPVFKFLRISIRFVRFEVGYG